MPLFLSLKHTHTHTFDQATRLFTFDLHYPQCNIISRFEERDFNLPLTPHLVECVHICLDMKRSLCACVMFPPQRMGLVDVYARVSLRECFCSYPICVMDISLTPLWCVPVCVSVCACVYTQSRR